MKQLLTIIMSVILLPSLSYAATPEEISKSYFDMLGKGQWTEMSRLFDPAAVKEFRETVSFIVDIPDEQATEFYGVFFGPGVTKATLKAMSDADFLAGFMRGVMAQAAQLGQFDFKKVEVLGSVPEGDSLRHVVTRTHMGLGDMEVEGMEVISFKKTDAGWKLLMQGRMKGMARQLKRVLEAMKQ